LEFGVSSMEITTLPSSEAAPINKPDDKTTDEYISFATGKFQP